MFFLVFWRCFSHVFFLNFLTIYNLHAYAFTFQGSLVPRLLDNTQQVLVRTAIVIRVVSFLPDTTPNPRSQAVNGSRKS